MRVVEYVRPDGSSPYRRWFETLNPQAAARVAVAVLRLSRGNTSNIKWFGGIGEYVIDSGPGYRIYLARDGEDLIIVFGGGTKRRQQSDIVNAKSFRSEYEARKAAARVSELRSSTRASGERKR